MGNKGREDYRLSQYIIDHDLYDDVCKASQTANLKEHLKPPAEDEITRSLREVKTNRVISVSSVFACRILLDILSALKDEVGRAHQKLLSVASKVSTTIKSTSIYSDDVTMPVC